MGLIPGSTSTGKFLGANDKDFVDRCTKLLREEIRIMQPKIILTLGKWVPPIISSLCPDLRDKWSGVNNLAEIDQREASLVYPVTFAKGPHPCAVAALTHPSNRQPNVIRRHYKRFLGNEAELALIKDALAYI